VNGKEKGRNEKKKKKRPEFTTGTTPDGKLRKRKHLPSGRSLRTRTELVENSARGHGGACPL
jgi:hypothetical protein